MRKMRFLMPIGFLALVAGVSVVIMLLWNWLMPAIFGLSVVSFWQALGLFILARILFGGFRFRDKPMKHRMMHFGHHIKKEWMKMTPEQRQEFINKRRAFFNKRSFFEEYAENTQEK